MFTFLKRLLFLIARYFASRRRDVGEGCLVAGTPIDTPAGQVAVEVFQPGDC